MPLFLFPLAFIGLVGVPALIAIYLFRNRFRRQPVSSLMLWIDARVSREGGVRIRTLQTPLLFLLELLVFLALVLGAADPYLRVAATARPLVVVLDDSYSMQAGGDSSPQRRAEEALRELLTQRPPFSVRFVLAGERPQVLGEAVRSAPEALGQLSRWHPFASEARLEPALSLAGELGGESALLLLLTDHPPPKNRIPQRGRVQWWSFGRPRDNVAITAAARSLSGELDRCLIEVSNFGRDAVSRSVQLIQADTEQSLQRLPLQLEPGEVRRLTLTLPAETGHLKASMEVDELPLDDAIDLLPVTPRPVRVRVQIRNNRLNDLVRRALEATRVARIVTDHPQLLLTDQADEPEVAETTWVMQFRTA
ncbi:MAG: BatA domain-containing protein, partial [Gemmataceae bacterium]